MIDNNGEWEQKRIRGSRGSSREKKGESKEIISNVEKGISKSIKAKHDFGID